MKSMKIILCILLPIHGFSQQTSPFRKFDQWTTVLKQARQENKPIFIDAYATWCIPCKEMDSKVFHSPAVANYLTRHFIALQVQLDKTERDPIYISSWYSDAAFLQKQFNINSFPTLLFLDPDGEIIFIKSGYQSADEFLTLLSHARDPGNYFVNKVQLFTSGKLPLPQLLDLALEAKEYKKDTLAFQIAGVYKTKSIDKEIKSKKIPSRAGDLLSGFYQLFSLQDPFISFLHQFPGHADSILGRKGISTEWVDFFIVKDIVEPLIAKAKNSAGPNWEMIRQTIARKYGQPRARRICLNQQIFYYHKIKDWDNAIKYEMEKIDVYGMDTAGLGKTMLNNLLYNVVFQHSNNALVLQKAIGYMEILLRNYPDADVWIDTYANLLYKSGRTSEALKYQQRAIEVATARRDTIYLSGYIDTFQKMQNNEPTWQ